MFPNHSDYWQTDSFMIPYAMAHTHTLRKCLYTIFFRNLKLSVMAALVPFILDLW